MKMKKEFATLIEKKEFEEASKLIFKTIFDISTPKNVKLNFLFEYENNISDLTLKLKEYYDEINISNAQITNKLTTEIFDKNEDLVKLSDKEKEKIIFDMSTLYENEMNLMKMKQYEQIFETTTETLKTTLQSVINFALKN